MYQRQASFGEAISSAFSNYANFSGRASRSQYWWFALFTSIVGFVWSFIVGILSAIQGWDIATVYVVTYLPVLAFLLPSWSLAVRRLHDIGKSGWWIFLALIPLVGSIILLVWVCQPSDIYPNEYGDVPLMEGDDQYNY